MSPSEAYPDDVTSSEERRRWRLVTMAAVAMYAPDGISTGRDRQVVERVRRAYFHSSHPSGEGDISAHQREELSVLGLL